MLQNNYLEQQLLESLTRLGYTGGEARIFLALLKSHPATGYELAKRSGVPRAAIYHALHRLEADGLIVAVEKKPARYLPLGPERLLGLFEERMKENLSRLRSALEGLSPRAPASPTYSIFGYEKMLEHARALIAGAKKSLHLSLWRREAEALAGHLRRAREGGLEVVLFSFNPLPQDAGEVLSYGIAEAELEKHWPHKIILIADRQRVLMGGAQPGEENQALYSEERALVEMAISNLVLDITLFGQRFGKDTSKVVGGLTSYLAPVEELAKT